MLQCHNIMLPHLEQNLNLVDVCSHAQLAGSLNADQGLVSSHHLEKQGCKGGDVRGVAIHCLDAGGRQIVECVNDAVRQGTQMHELR